MIYLPNPRRAFVAVAFLIVTSLVVGASSLSPRVNVLLSGTVSRDGRQISLEEAGKVAPREVINWNITATNVGNSPAVGVSVVGDIDDGTIIIPGSATGDGVVSVKYSTEHPHKGQAFYERPMVHVKEGGSVKERPATPAELKAIQLTFSKIGPGETLKASYRTRVR